VAIGSDAALDRLAGTVSSWPRTRSPTGLWR